MKTTRIIIIIIGIIAGTGMMTLTLDDNYDNYAYGLWIPLSPEVLIEQSKTIFVGNVTAIDFVDVEYQSNISQDGTVQDNVGSQTLSLEEYTIHVEEFLKNPQHSDTMKVLRATVSGVPGMPAKISGFEIGDRVVFYLPKDEGQTHFIGQYLPESFKIPKHCNAEYVIKQPRIIGSNDFRMMQDGIVMHDNFTANKKIQFVFDKDMHTLDSTGFNVGVAISKMLGKEYYQNVLKEDIRVDSPPCKWIVTAQWDLVLDAGEYTMRMSYGEEGDSGRSISSSGFSVIEDTSSGPKVAKLEWSQFNYAVTNGTGKVKVIVTDPDMNVLHDKIDTLKVLVYSDSDREGITITLYETEKDIGIFEREFTFSDKRSAPNVLYAFEGDTVTAKYVDLTPPLGAEPENIEMTKTMFLGLTGPPLERAPAMNARIVDSYGNTIYVPAVGEQVLVMSDVANGMDREQKFAWLAQINNEENQIVSLSWIDGILNPKNSFSPSTSWIPEEEGQYTATMFVWESVDNPTALSPPISLEFTVGPEELREQRYFNEGNYDEMFLFIIPEEDFKLHLNKEKLATLHFYKIENQEELSQLPRLDLLINMTRDFPEEPVTELKLRISELQLEQYRQFFTQKCHDERPYAKLDSCTNTDLAFDYNEKWYYLYNDLAPHRPTIEDGSPGWDANYFKND